MATSAGFSYLDVEKGTPRPRFPTLPLHDFCDGSWTWLRTRAEKCTPGLQLLKVWLCDFGCTCLAWLLAALALALMLALCVFLIGVVLMLLMFACTAGDSVQLTVTGTDVAGGGVIGRSTASAGPGTNITTDLGGGGLDPEPAYGPPNLTLTVAARNPNRSLRVRYDALRADLWCHGRMVGVREKKGVFVQPGHSTRAYRVPVTVAAVDRELAADMAHGVVPVRAELTVTYQFRRGPLRGIGGDEYRECDMSVTPPAPGPGRIRTAAGWRPAASTSQIIRIRWIKSLVSMYEM